MGYASYAACQRLHFVQLRLDPGIHYSLVMGTAFLSLPLLLYFFSVSTQQDELRELHLVQSYAC